MRISTLIVSFLLINGTSFAQYGQLNNNAEVGYAVYYADYLNGRPTALGEIYNGNIYTCAHKTHPLGTILKVTRIDNGASVVVRVNDRGPFNPGLVVDLSKIAAQKIDLITVGKTKVSIKVIGHSDKNPTNKRGDEYNYGRISEGYDYPAGEVLDMPQLYDIGTEKGLSIKGQKSKARDGVAFLPSDQLGYAIQLASFSDYSNAQRQFIALRNNGIDNLYIKEEIQRGKRLYKIVIAAFSTNEKAQSYLQNARSMYKVNGIVIKLR